MNAQLDGDDGDDDGDSWLGTHPTGAASALLRQSWPLRSELHSEMALVLVR